MYEYEPYTLHIPSPIKEIQAKEVGNVAQRVNLWFFQNEFPKFLFFKICGVFVSQSWKKGVYSELAYPTIIWECKNFLNSKLIYNENKKLSNLIHFSTSPVS